jgi:uncharacterized protein (DUF885 family)
MLRHFSVCLLLLLSYFSPPTRAAIAPAPEQLDKIYEAEWQRWLREDPTVATYAGDNRYNGQWPDLSPAAFEATHKADLAALAMLNGFDVSALAAADRQNYQVVKRVFERRIASYAFKPYVYWINHQGGVLSDGYLPGSIQVANEATEFTPFNTVQDYENWISRLNAFGKYLDQGVALLQIGIREKRTQPRVIMERITAQIAAQRVARAEDSPFYEPFKHMPESFSAADRVRLAAAGRTAIEAGVLPAFARFDKFFNSKYLPACRTSVGISATPDGAAYYRERIAYHTTTRLGADEIHALGLTEVTRIRAEMDKIIATVGFKGDFQAFAHYLRTDPEFVYKDGDELFRGYAVIAKSIDPNLVRLFGKLPRTPYGVRPIPATSAPDNTTAYYQPMSSDGSRPGYFYVNLYKPEARPKWEMEVLTAHEAVPGHHLQTALQYEAAGQTPMIRRMAGFTAYVEGWGLYSESLGGDLGLYTDPYSKFGQLTYDMWRAVRLVVDTGMHAKGWSRQQAIDFFKANAPKSELDITNEIDRYISWPGQALAYKIGQLKIMELRDLARKTLGDKFDIREFHDVVLATGAVPLDILEAAVRDWLKTKT